MKHKNNYYKIGLAVSNFYPDLTDQLISGVCGFFEKQDKKDKSKKKNHFEFYKAISAGSTELPLVADWLFQYRQCHAVIALGIVVRGKTTHYDSVCRMLEYGIINVQLKWSKPVINSVIMAEDMKQVQQRLSKKKHIGQMSAQACLKMLQSFHDLSKKK